MTLQIYEKESKINKVKTLSRLPIDQRIPEYFFGLLFLGLLKHMLFLKQFYDLKFYGKYSLKVLYNEKTPHIEIKFN